MSRGIHYLEEATTFVNQLSLFSSNENVEEISTNNLKYLLLPALLGSLTLKLTKRTRYDLVQMAEIYFKDYIQRLNDYEICNINIRTSDKDSETTKSTLPSSILEMAKQRNEKIARFRRSKELQAKISELRTHLSKGSVEDEISREYYLTLIKRWTDIAIEELLTIESEKQILEHMQQMKSGKPPPKESDIKRIKTPLKPFIITRNETQKKVFGLGYPSVPTVTIDEFVNQKIQEGSLSVQKNPEMYVFQIFFCFHFETSLIYRYENSLLSWANDPDKKKYEDENEEEEKEKKLESEDQEEIQKARRWDEWKDGNLRTNFKTNHLCFFIQF